MWSPSDPSPVLQPMELIDFVNSSQIVHGRSSVAILVLHAASRNSGLLHERLYKVRPELPVRERLAAVRALQHSSCA